MPYKDIEKRRACKRAWNRKNKEYFENWHEEHPEFLANQCKKIGKLRRENPETRKRMQGNRLKSIYGITQEAYQQKFLEQNGVCAICGRPEKRKTPEGRPWALAVDHKHDDTKQVRGLLCLDCNAALGLFCDSNLILSSAIAYIAKWTKEE